MLTRVPNTIIQFCIRLFDKYRNYGLEGLDEFDETRIRFLNTSIIISLLGLWANVIVDILTHRHYALPLVFAYQIPLYFCIYLLKKRHHGLAKFVYLLILAPSVLSGQFYIAETGSEQYAFVFILIAFNILRNKKSFIAITVLYVIYYILLVILLRKGILVRSEYLENTNIVYYVNSSLALIITSILAYRYTLESTHKIGEMKTLNSTLFKQNKLAHELLRELNHRVKNNLQIVSSLFNLQGYSTEDIETKNALKDARHRINAIAILHQSLYQDELIFSVNVDTYLKSLCEYLLHSDTNPETASITTNADDITLQIKETIYIGLIVNELVTNALKYGEGVDGTTSILVSFKTTKTHYSITVKDCGQGFPQDTLPDSATSFGLNLVNTIVEQYDGSMALIHSNTPGAHVEAQLEFE